MDAKMIRTAIAAICVATVSSVHGRSLIHYFDFDTPSGNGLAYTGVDKGTLPANFTLKGSSVPRTTGAQGADYASAVVGDMTFQSGTEEAPSIINVNLAGKTDLNAIRKSESPYVVTWPSQPANVNFVLDAQSSANGYKICPEAEGLRLERFMGIVILVR